MSSDALGSEFFEARKKDVKHRVSEKRFNHIEGVADTAGHLADVYGVDVASARLAGLLHDWDKGMDDEQIRARAKELGLEDELGAWVVENMPQVIHGPTAAVALKREFPQIPYDVIQAIYRHTTAALEMSDLDKVIYIADAIEPGRKFKHLKELQDQIGKSTLDELYYQVYRFWTMALIEHGAVLHPDTIPIWNKIAAERKLKLAKGGKHSKKKKARQ